MLQHPKHHACVVVQHAFATFARHYKRKCHTEIDASRACRPFNVMQAWSMSTLVQHPLIRFLHCNTEHMHAWYIAFGPYLQAAQHCKEGLCNDCAEQQVTEGGYSQATGAGLQGLDLSGVQPPQRTPRPGICPAIMHTKPSGGIHNF